MSAAATPPSRGPLERAEGPSARRDGLQRVAERAAPLVAQAYALWYRRRSRVDLGPGLGFVHRKLVEEEVEAAVPAERPPEELIARAPGASMAADSGPTEALRRANQWAAVLEDAVRGDVRGDVLTTFGFFRANGRLWFGVIRYLRPIDAFRRAGLRPSSVEVGGHTFPVIVRPWLGEPSSTGTRDRTAHPCWVSFGGRRGFVTAAHALLPKDAAVGAAVETDTLLRHPSGRLAFRSTVMDAAVVEVDEPDWGGAAVEPCSTVVGYKPVRFYLADRVVDLQVTEHSGFVGATTPIPGSSGEPFAGVFLILSNDLGAGWSGTVGYDREFATFQPDAPEYPYVLYEGRYRPRAGTVGYGLLLQQAALAWTLEFHRDKEERQ